MNDLGARPARSEDAAAIAAIYNGGIADRIATFETEPRTTAQIAALDKKGGGPRNGPPYPHTPQRSEAPRHSRGAPRYP